MNTSKFNRNPEEGSQYVANSNGYSTRVLEPRTRRRQRHRRSRLSLRRILRHLPFRAISVDKSCKKCKSNVTMRSRQRGLIEKFFGFLGLKPYRCFSCGNRFLRPF